MRIGFDAKRFFDNPTGLGQYSRFVIKALASYGTNHEYYLYAAKNSQRTNVKKILCYPNIHQRIPSHWSCQLFKGRYWRAMALYKEAFKDGVEVFHGLSNELPLTPKPKIRSVVTIHDLIVKRYPNFYNPVDVAIYSLKLRHACRTAAAIIAVSKQTAKDIVRYFNVDNDKVHVIYQGCDASYARSIEESKLNSVSFRYCLPNEYALTVGTIEARKNLLLIVKAWQRLKNPIPLVVVGRPTRYLYQVNRYIAKYQLQNSIIFLHNVPIDDLPSIYRLAKIFIYPSLFEGFGIPIVEAISSRVPVIAATGSCLSEAGGPHSRYVNPHDEEELACAVRDVLSDVTLRESMVEQSIQYINQFSSDNIATSLIKTYQSVLE